MSITLDSEEAKLLLSVIKSHISMVKNDPRHSLDIQRLMSIRFQLEAKIKVSQMPRF